MHSSKAVCLCVKALTNVPSRVLVFRATRARITYFAIRRVAKRPDSRTWATVLPCGMACFPQCEGAREKKGCGHERENPRSGLLSADTFGAASFAETP